MKKHNKLIVFMVFTLITCCLAIGSVSAADTGTNITNTTGLANSSSPEYGTNNNHTSQSRYKGPQTNTTKWTKKNITMDTSAVSIGANGTIYVGTRDGGLFYALDPDGNTLWTYNIGDSVRSTPAIGNDGAIYIITQNNQLYALSSKGKLIWDCTLDGRNLNSNSPVIGSDGTIYIGSDSGSLYAINSKNGTVKWAYNTGGTSLAPVIGSDGTIYATSGGILYAIKPNGQEKWKKPIAGSTQSCNGLSIGSDGTIYMGSYEGKLYAINPTTGEVKWAYQTDYTYGGVVGSPAVSSNGTIYIMATDQFTSGCLYAVNPDGQEKWRYEIQPFMQGVPPVIGSDGTIYLGTYNMFAVDQSLMYAITSNGDLLWSYAIASLGAPTIGPDSTLYIGGVVKNGDYLNGTLYAFKDPDTVAPTITNVDPANNAVNVPTNKTIKVTFSEPIKAGSYWIELKDSTGKAVDFTKSINKNVLTITPTSSLKGTKYTLILHTGSLTDLAGNKLALYTSTFTTDATAPIVKIIDPANKAANVAVSKIIKVTFNETIKAGTNYIELKDSKGKAVPFTTSISGNILTITPTNGLVNATTYSLILHTGYVTDLAGNKLALYSSSFTTDRTAPTVKIIDPANKAVNVAVSKIIKVTFNESIKAGSNYIELKDSKGNAVPFKTSISGNILTITPTGGLVNATTYSLILHTGCVTDLAGNKVAVYSSSFTTDRTAPTVKIIDPANKAANIAVNKNIKVTFSESIKAGSNYIELKNSKGKSVPVKTSISGNVLTITPTTNLTKGTKYTLILHTGCVTDLSGNKLALYTSIFTTV